MSNNVRVAVYAVVVLVIAAATVCLVLMLGYFCGQLSIQDTVTVTGYKDGLPMHNVTVELNGRTRTQTDMDGIAWFDDIPEPVMIEAWRGLNERTLASRPIHYGRITIRMRRAEH
jgi:hypothetical protein